MLVITLEAPLVLIPVVVTLGAEMVAVAAIDL